MKFNIMFTVVFILITIILQCLCLSLYKISFGSFYIVSYDQLVMMLMMGIAGFILSICVSKLFIGIDEI